MATQRRATRSTRLRTRGVLQDQSKCDPNAAPRGCSETCKCAVTGGDWKLAATSTRTAPLKEPRVTPPDPTRTIVPLTKVNEGVKSKTLEDRNSHWIFAQNEYLRKL
uniref:Uncharacterized protein n=1 Tax=Opuntia streptacantha TaxID=393608 RepID=A0A7C9EGC8_OPUST